MPKQLQSIAFRQTADTDRASDYPQQNPRHMAPKVSVTQQTFPFCHFQIIQSAQARFLFV